MFVRRHWTGRGAPVVAGEPVEFDALITPNFPFGSSRETVGDYVKN